jgi:hypothetical protein
MQSWDWQLIVSLAFVALAAGVLARRMFGLLAASRATGKRDVGCGLGGCTGCAAGPKSAGPATHTLVSLEVPEKASPRPR